MDSNTQLPQGPEFAKLKNNVFLTPLAVVFAVLFGLLGLAFLVLVHDIPLGLVLIIVAGGAALVGLKLSEASNSLEEMGCPEIAAKVKQSGIKFAASVMCVVIVFAGIGGYISHQMDLRRAEQQAEAWDQLAVATATVALDQFAPETDYGPVSLTGWMVIHNNDGTTTVWAPREYGRIAVMLTDDGEAYTPYYISVDGEIKLGK